MGARILIIEDNPANLQLLIYLLEAFGHVALSATDGIEGLEIARQAAPDLIICDVQLPRMDGYEVARRLKAEPKLRTVPLVAVTAFAMPGDRERTLASGFDGYIAKPIAPETFLDQLNRYLPSGKHAVQPHIEHAGRPAPAPASRPLRGTILVVDDSRINQELIRHTLEPMGYKLVLADNLAAALELTGRRSFDMILSDLHMPGGGGHELLRVMKSEPNAKATPIVIISSTSMGTFDRHATMALGAAGFIVRPIEPTDLLAQVETCLQESAEV